MPHWRRPLGLGAGSSRARAAYIDRPGSPDIDPIEGAGQGAPAVTRTGYPAGPNRAVATALEATTPYTLTVTMGQDGTHAG